MGVSKMMAARMMANAGMNDNAMVEAVSVLKGYARCDGGDYYNPNAVSRYIRKHGV